VERTAVAYYPTCSAAGTRNYRHAAAQWGAAIVRPALAPDRPGHPDLAFQPTKRSAGVGSRGAGLLRLQLLQVKRVTGLAGGAAVNDLIHPM